MGRQDIRALLTGYNPVYVDGVINHISRLETEKKDGVLRNPWAPNVSNEKVVQFFKKVHDQGLVLDGVHVTISNTGLSYDYIAYKNKMLLTYPETILDVQLVYKDDKFSFSKESGKVIYSHILQDPFNQKDADIVGAYCVIKNRRGEMLTTISREDIEKHKKVAKTKAIWDAWYKEMCLKTIIKKGVKVHFEDVFTEILEDDNEENDLSLLAPTNPETLTEMKAKMDACTTEETLKQYWQSIPVQTPAINQMCTERRDQIRREAAAATENTAP